MKFLSKRKDSEILSKGMVYKENRADNNKALLEKLIEEQKRFCAYTEKYIEELDSVEVEHLDSLKKYNDDYYNYYAVLRKANQYKKDEKYKGAHFFETLFFHSETEFNKRIQYIDGIYEEIDSEDAEARDFIDFLGLNEHLLTTQRNYHVKRKKEHFELSCFNEGQIINYFKKYKSDLSFITALEAELGISLTSVFD